MCPVTTHLVKQSPDKLGRRPVQGCSPLFAAAALGRRETDCFGRTGDNVAQARRRLPHDCSRGAFKLYQLAVDDGIAFQETTRLNDHPIPARKLLMADGSHGSGIGKSQGFWTTHEPIPMNTGT